MSEGSTWCFALDDYVGMGATVGAHPVVPPANRRGFIWTFARITGGAITATTRRLR
ncbi:MAG: hypothetical protein LBH11_00905 [Propionibacteriaceae bacterium]|nr:hypothetical protein [Propionibacteriaceae bacterium]